MWKTTLNTFRVTQMETENVQQREIFARWHKLKLPLLYHTSIHTTLFYKHTYMKRLYHKFNILFFVAWTSWIAPLYVGNHLKAVIFFWLIYSFVWTWWHVEGFCPWSPWRLGTTEWAPFLPGRLSRCWFSCHVISTCTGSWRPWGSLQSVGQQPPWQAHQQLPPQRRQAHQQ